MLQEFYRQVPVSAPLLLFCVRTFNPLVVQQIWPSFTWLLMGTLNVVFVLHLTTISRISKIFGNFERPFTPQTWLHSVSNFAKTRFGRFPTFHFSTPGKKLVDIFDRKISFLQFWPGFWGATEKRTSKSDPASNFALDTLILGSVWPKNMTFWYYAITRVW